MIKAVCPLFLLLSLPLVSIPSAAFAQAELSGSFVDYLGFGANGVMVNSSDHSQRYSETGMAPYTCDVFATATALESFGIEATGTLQIDVRNDFGFTDVATTSGPVVAGRDINWVGAYTNGVDSLRVTQRASLGVNDRHVRLNVTIENTGNSALTDVYYMRVMDPDHGGCGIGNTSFRTENDVLRQPPVDEDALIVARARGIPNNYILGLGAFDTRGRVHSEVEVNSTPISTWINANDPNGAYADQPIAIAFKVDEILAGQSAVFDILYVWGLSDQSVEDRFDELRCTILGDGSVCTQGGANGLCRAGACCTGCWDGASCQSGRDAAECGAAGALCMSCADGVACTKDVCSANGTCSNPNEPAGLACDDGQFCFENDQCDGSGVCQGTPTVCADGLSCTTDSCDEQAGSCANSLNPGSCLIDNQCYANGAADPAETCLECDAAADPTAFSPAPATKSCNDGAFCTVDDRCDGAGACAGGGQRDCRDQAFCTLDTCNEMTNQCVNTIPSNADRCLIGGECVAGGQVNPNNPCQVCDPLRDGADWSPASAGTMCDDGLTCTEADVCNANGQCAGAVRSCEDGLTCTANSCSEALGGCQSDLAAGSCRINNQCFTDGDINPANPCERCDPSSPGVWSPVAAGTSCEDASDFCMVEACDGAGACLAANRDCEDGLSCTAGACDEVGDTCVQSAVAGECFVDGQCFLNGDPNPATPCQVCVSSNGLAWSPAASGTACSDNVFCTENDACDGAGACAGSVRSCDDGVACTTTSCDTVLDACATIVNPGLCAIDGMCIPDGTANPNDACGVCNAAMNQGDWSYTDASPACDTDGDCVPDGAERVDGLDIDTDGDDTPDYLDVDDDGDGIGTRDERGPNCDDIDTDGDQILDYRDDNDDDDCILTKNELLGGAPFNSDDDDIPNHLDDDDDNDTIPTCTEVMDGVTHGNDVDDDGDANWLDTNSDGDERDDMTELREDDDGDGIPNYLDPDDNTAQPEGGVDGGRDGGPGADSGDANWGYAGGACKCSTKSRGPAQQSLFGFLVLALALGFRRRRKLGSRRRHRGLMSRALVVLFLITLSSVSITSAQDSLHLNRFRPAPLVADGIGVSRPTTHGNGFGGQIFLDYSHDALVVEGDPGNAGTERASIVEHQLAVHLVGSYAFADRFAVFAGLDINPVMSGETFAGAVEADGFGIGDVYLGGRARIYGEDGDVFLLGAELRLDVPLANLANGDQRFSGEDSIAVTPKLLGEVRSDALRVSASVGASIRKASAIRNISVGPELTYGLAIGYGVLDNALEIIGEFRGSSRFSEFGQREHSPNEVALGARYHTPDGITVAGAVGTGVTRGLGSPDFRGLLSLGVGPFYKAPPGDRDGDGLQDDVDQCPDEPEDMDGYQDDDGCPELDNDGDGIVDADDQCPMEPEDLDGFEDADGCPDPDNDKDGVLDVDDACPLAPGKQDDGCPEAVRVSIADSTIVVLKHVEFEYDKARLKETSKSILNEIAQVLDVNAQIRRIRIEGHTDLAGSASYNKDLSMRRARSVARYLVLQGVGKSRMEAFGCGESRPVEDLEKSQKNRRVEFRIVDPPNPSVDLSTDGCQQASLDNLDRRDPEQERQKGE